MPTCDARYDVIFNDGGGGAPGGGLRYQAQIDMREERLPDEWGDPGPLLFAQLKSWRTPIPRRIAYAPHGDRMALWVDGIPRIAKAYRRHLRWHLPDEDPAPDYDPDWILPP